MNDSLADDAFAVLLLCAFQGGEGKHYPLGLAEYNRIATILYRRQKRPAFLLGDAPVHEIANSAQVNHCPASMAPGSPDQSGVSSGRMAEKRFLDLCAKR